MKGEENGMAGNVLEMCIRDSVYVVGGSDGAVKEALYLSKSASQVTIIHFEDGLGCIAEFREKAEKCPNMIVRLNSRLHGVYGTERVDVYKRQGWNRYSRRTGYP